MKQDVVKEIDGQWFNLKDPLEEECYNRGSHHWGRDKYTGSDGQGGPDPTMGYHHCQHCYRCEPL